MILSLVNKSTSPAVTQAFLEATANAVTVQLLEFCNVYGLAPSALQVLTPGMKVDAELTLFDDADQAGDLGYHTETPTGVQYGRIFVRDTVSAGGQMSTGAFAVSTVVSHEALELVADPRVNAWVRDGSGRWFAFEVCDPVEGQFYVQGGVSVSNYVRPAWFDPLATGAGSFDRLGVVSRPFEIAPQGYAIILGADGQPATMPARIMPASKNHPASRTAKRIAEGGVMATRKSPPPLPPEVVARFPASEAPPADELEPDDATTELCLCCKGAGRCTRARNRLFVTGAGK